MLQEQLRFVRTKEKRCSRQELGQYGRRLCVRIDAVPTADNEASN